MTSPRPLSLVVAFLLAATLLCLPGCPRTCVGVACLPPDAGLAARVCANLKELQCKEGLAANCEVATKKGIELGAPAQCWLDAKDKGLARACGQLDCP
jgi:hypothetical protein